MIYKVANNPTRTSNAFFRLERITTDDKILQFVPRRQPSILCPEIERCSNNNIRYSTLMHIDLQQRIDGETNTTTKTHFDHISPSKRIL